MEGLSSTGLPRLVSKSLPLQTVLFYLTGSRNHYRVQYMACAAPEEGNGLLCPGLRLVYPADARQFSCRGS